MKRSQSIAGRGEAIPILMPQSGNTMEEGTVIEWHVEEGDSIEVGQVICEIETDKATMEYESPVSGRLSRIVAKAEEPVAVKEIIAVVAEEDTAADAFLANKLDAKQPIEFQAVGNEAETIEQETKDRADVKSAHDAQTRIIASPAARRPRRGS